jgi:hypothetical protein
MILEARVKRGDQYHWVAVEVTISNDTVENITVLSTTGNLQRKLEIILSELVEKKGQFNRQIIQEMIKKEEHDV